MVPMRAELAQPSIQRLWVPGEIYSLNQILDDRVAAASVAAKSGKRFNGYSATKKQITTRVKLLARAARLLPVEAGYFTYLIRERSQRRDPSNVAAGAVKMLEDGLKEAGVIRNDGWACILGFVSYWMVDARNPGVTVFITQRMVLDRSDAIWRDEEARKRNVQGEQ